MTREIERRARLRAADKQRIFVPLILSIGLFGLYAFFWHEPLVVKPYGDIRDLVFGNNLNGLLFVAWAAMIFFLVRLFDTFTFDFVVGRRRRTGAPLLLRQMISIVLYVLLFGAAISKFFNYKISTLLTTGTVLAAVVGLALQDTLGNLFSGIALHMEDAYEVGDVIHSGEYTGVIEGVTWRSTRVRGFNNQVIVIPNALVSRERFEVFPRMNPNARVLSVGVDYHVPPATVIEILTNAASHVEGVARDLPCFARLGGFSDSAVNYEIKYFTRDYSLRDRIDADIRKAVWYALRRNNITFATPIRSYTPYTPPKTEHPVTLAETVARLHQVDVLSPLPANALERIAAATKVHFFSRGEAILRHGAAGDSMFVVHSGDVSIRLIDPNETNGWRELAQLGPGTVFGEMALLTGETRTADVVATTDVVALEIGKDSLQPILQDHPELAAAISAKVMERRDTLANGKEEEEERSVLSRIRDYFGL